MQTGTTPYVNYFNTGTTTTENFYTGASGPNGDSPTPSASPT